ncbi:MAG: hypothetical protein ACFFDN_04860 [Candidatus Hodarchaeota archaeon]
MTIRKTKVIEAIRLIEEANKSSKMKNANFEDLFSEKTIIKRKEITSFIRDRTKLFRETWIIERLEKALEILKQELDR